MKFLLLPVSIVLALCIFHCGKSSSPTAEGSGTETTNGLYVASAESVIQGHVFTVPEDDSTKRLPLATSSVRITIYSADYMSFFEGFFSDTTYPDINGNFSFRNLDSGHYNLLAVQTTDYKALMVPDIPVFPITESYSEDNFFDTTGSISGSLNYTNDIDTIVAVIYIMGTPFADFPDTSNTFSLNRLPLGKYWIIAEYYIFTGNQYIKMEIPPTGNISNNIGRNILIDNDNLSQTIEISFFN